SALQAFQIAANSLSSSTRSRGVELAGLLVPTTALASHSPSPTAQANSVDRADLARDAVTVPLLRVIASNLAATSARVISPMVVACSGAHEALAVRAS